MKSIAIYFYINENNTDKIQENNEEKIEKIDTIYPLYFCNLKFNNDYYNLIFV